MFFSQPKLFLEIDEELSLSKLLILLQKCPKKIELYLVVIGKWHFFHTITGIKQIKEATQNVNLFVITKDEVALKMLKSAEVDIAVELPKDSKDFYDEVFPEHKFDENIIGKAFAAQEFELVKIIKETGEKHISKLGDDFKEISLRNKIILAITGTISLAIIAFLIALILPSATVTIEAQKKSVQTVVNINFNKTDKNFAEKLENVDNNFYLYPLEFRFEHQMTYPVLSKIFEGQNAIGDVTLYNNHTEDLTLRNGTRLQTESGLIFLTKHYVRIPAKKASKNEKGQIVYQPGEALVNIIANDVDLFKEVIGSRGNIPPQKFIVPGLTSYMQKFIWGESKKEFHSGTTRWRVEVQQSDLDAAKAKMNNILLSKAKTKFLENIQQINNDNKANKNNLEIALFPLEEHIKTEIFHIDYPKDILGKDIKEFNVFGEMLVSAFVYANSDFVKFMQSHIDKRRDPNMKIEKIGFDIMTFREFSHNNSEIRVAVDLQGRQSFKIDNKSEEGVLFQKKLKDQLKGLDKNEAMKLVYNQPEISKADIRIWPPLKKRLPLIKDNIKIVEKQIDF